METTQVGIHTGFHHFMKIGQIFRNKIIYYKLNKKFQVEIERWNNPPICKPSSKENGTGQYADSESQERSL